jgi:hypothetical protein
MFNPTDDKQACFIVEESDFAGDSSFGFRI